MRIATLCGLVFIAGCAGTPPPPPVAPEPPPDGIATAAVTPATQAPVPAPPAAPAAPPPQDLPASLTREQVQKTFDHHSRFFYEPYRERIATRGELSGTMQVTFTISPEGSPGPATLFSSTVQDEALERAVLAQIGKMTFPPARGPTPVERYPLVFSPK